MSKMAVSSAARISLRQSQVMKLQLLVEQDLPDADDERDDKR